MKKRATGIALMIIMLLSILDGISITVHAEVKNNVLKQLKENE